MKEMNYKPGISVIIPVYNVENYIGKCIDSVLNQTFQDFEIIIVNDGSTDNSQNVIDELLHSYPEKIRSFKKDNGGLSSARNYALDRAKGEYVTFLDSDDYLDSDYLEVHYKEAMTHNSDMVISGQKKVSEDGSIIKRLKYPVQKNPNTILRRLNISGKIYKRSYIEKHKMRFADGKIYEDDPFNLVMLFLAENLRILDYEGYNQLVRAGSITSKKIDAARMPYAALEKSISYVVENKEKVNDFLVFEYTVMSFFTYFIFQANKKHQYMKKNKNRTSDYSTVEEFIDFSNRMMRTYFPEYNKNPNLNPFLNTDLLALQRLGVFTYSLLNRTNMLKLFAKVYYAF